MAPQHLRITLPRAKLLLLIIIICKHEGDSLFEKPRSRSAYHTILYNGTQCEKESAAS
jgi:hypothetical protein